jgi:preprotein translocase subunit SecG
MGIGKKKMEKNDIKEKLIVLGVTVGLFFPIRIFFSSYVSDYWLGSLGIMSVLAILLVVLIKRRKLGEFGKIFERQMQKTVGGKTGKYLIGFVIFFLVYFGATLFFIDRGNNVYFEDKEIFFYAIMEEGGYNINDLSSYGLMGPHLATQNSLKNFNLFSSLDYMFSIAYAVMNDMSEGWLEHIVIVMFVEQIELIGLLVLYRNIFKPISKVKISN